MARILIAEDAADVRDALERALVAAGHQVCARESGMAMLREVTRWKPELVVLDLGLPDLDGGLVLDMVRSMSEVPVVIASGRGHDKDVTRLLLAGADDYLVKPYSAAELDARIRAVLRRTQPEPPALLVVGGLRIDPVGRQATIDGRDLRLTRLEFELLSHLAERRDRTVPRAELTRRLRPHVPAGGRDTIDTHVYAVRRKLGESAARPAYLHTVRGVGYQLGAPPQVDGA
ncbi:DNA-binding response regulator [Longispora fulva]|uniref:DNA-binding response OmpR family regulator n=1 Tax=Longispora fulva TaxID=619741 RepID=A0A8J7GIA7_9ACTN|nr:response regulator transcription factor [Longispora fulva]MBG6136928.1 DNA-binding response OmpR family regulator [Longispora fulva]GIG61719.1 DNA-binding response regulator [Longispora fulva]